jgi:hypothetical protein
VAFFDRVLNEKTGPGRFAEGPRYPGRSCPPPQCASKKLVEKLFAAGVRSPGSSACGFFSRRKFSGGRVPGRGIVFPAKNLFIFVAAEKLVALNGGDDADGAFVAGLGALNAAEAAYTHGAGKSDLVGKSQKNFNRRAFLDIFLKEEVDTAGADVAGLGAGLADRRARGPTNGERQPHGKALCGAAFGASQSEPPHGRESVTGWGPLDNRTPGTKTIQFGEVPMY